MSDLTIDDIKVGDTILLKDTDSKGNKIILSVTDIKSTLNGFKVFSFSLSNANYPKEVGEDNMATILKKESVH